MKRTLLRHWKILVPVVCLAALFAAEKLDLSKSDSVSAAACTKELFLPRPDASAIIRQHRESISAEATRHDLPPELLATIIYAHQRELTSFRRFADCAGSAMGSDLSLGLAQIRISTAIGNDGHQHGSVSHATFRRYRSLLLDPVQNIRYLTREARLLLDRANRLPGIGSEELIHNPSGMALLMSEYRMGRQSARNTAARLSANALRDLGYMQEDDVYIFGRDAADVSRIQGLVSEYLDYIYCEKGIFDFSACEERLEEI